MRSCCTVHTACPNARHYSTVDKLRNKNVRTAVTGVVRNYVDHNRSTYRLLDEALGESGLPVLATEVPMRAGFQNAVTAGTPLVAFSPSHPGAVAMRDLAAELLNERVVRKAA